MKFTLSWLKDHLETDSDAQAIAEKLTAIGLEVESIEDAGARLRDFTVAHVISAEKHPNADKLKLCMADAGTGSLVQVVCGAPNAHAGMKAVFAKPGVTIPATGDVLKVGIIRGVESRGMLCSARELGLGENHTGIIELPADAKIGEPASRALDLNDPVIDVAITPDRGDATNVYGIARDLAAADFGTLKNGSVRPVPGQFRCPKNINLNFTREAAGACPVFAGRLIRNVKNGLSPAWVQERLKAVGLRPISAMVDATNLVSLDRGRPLHAFDADKLVGDVQARLAEDGEQILALDGKTYTLDSAICVIADDKAARSIAGVMGGEDTACTESTTNVFIESAYFGPARIAQTGRKLGIVSDARYRFERGVDPEFVIPGLELATQLILEFCGGEPSEIVVAGHVPDWKRTISFSTAAVKRLAGLDVPKPEIIRILTNLGFEITGGDPLQVRPPSWRGDVEGAADLVEEVVRIYGLENVPSTPMSRPHAIARPVLTPAQRRTGLVRRELASRGFNETIGFTFMPRVHAALFGGGDAERQIKNPIGADLDALRPSLLPSLLAAAQKNAARGFGNLMLFEIGVQFESGMPGDQQSVAAGIRLGEPPRSWTKATNAIDPFDAKADMLAAVETAMGGAMAAPVRPGAAPWYHPGRSGTLTLGPKLLAYFGELHPKVLAAFDFKGPAAAFEVFLDAIPEPKAKSNARRAFTPSQFQPVERDFAFVLDAKVSADEVIKAAKSAERALIERVDVFDVYEGKGVPEGKKSLAISVRLHPKDRTLTDTEIETIAQKIVTSVERATGGVLRT